MAFSLDSVTLVGRFQLATFDGVHAHVAGVGGFLFAAWWWARRAEILRRPPLARAAPWGAALLASGIGLALKYAI